MNRRILLVLLVGLALAGCSDLRGDRIVTGMSAVEQPDGREPAQPDTRPGAIEVRNVADSGAFAFGSTELSSGRAVLGTELVEGGPVVMSFVVPRCAACIAAGPDLAASAAAHPEITFVFVHSGGTPDAYGQYLERTGFAPPGSDVENVVHLDDSPGLLWARFGVIQQPTSVLIAADGSVTQSLGALGAEELRDVVDRLASP